MLQLFKRFLSVVGVQETGDDRSFANGQYIGPIWTLYQAVVVAMLVCTRYYNVYNIALVNKTFYPSINLSIYITMY